MWCDKYKPNNEEEFIGNEEIVEYLKNIKDSHFILIS